MRLTERLSRLWRASPPEPDRKPPPCVGCRGRADRLEPIEVAGVEPSTGTSRIGPVAGLQTAVVDDQLVVLDPNSARRVLLNASAALIFTAIDAERRLDEIVAQIAEESGMSADLVGEDVRSTVDRLLAQGMLTRDDLDVATLTEAADSEVDRGDVPVDPTDGIVWAYDSGPLRIAGTTVAVRAEANALATRLSEALTGFAPAEGLTAAAHRIEIVEVDDEADDGTSSNTEGVQSQQVVVDGRVRTGPLDSATVLATALDQLDLVLVDGTRGLRFHAGAVERDGEVVIVLGQSGQGKSTLTAALVQAGWKYLTDELAVVDPSSRFVHSYPRPFDLDETSRSTLGLAASDLATSSHKDKVLPSRFGSTSTGGHATLIVLLTGEPPAGTDLVSTIPAAEALMALLALTFAPTFGHADALADLGRLCETTRTIRLSRGPLAEMVGAVEAQLADRAVSRSAR